MGIVGKLGKKSLLDPTALGQLTLADFLNVAMSFGCYKALNNCND